MGRDKARLTVDHDTLHVTMGWAFNADIPLASIKAASRESGRVFSMGVHGWRGNWLVNGSTKGLVKLELDPPVRAKASGFATDLHTLRLSVTDPEDFLGELRASPRP